MSDLTDFGMPEVKPPLVKREYPVLSPTTGKVAGFLGSEVRRDTDMSVYTTLRGRRHFYREGGGYAVSNRILDLCAEMGVNRIVVHEGTSDTDDVLEYPARAYFNSESEVHEADLENPQDPQTYVPVESYLHKWADHAAALFVSEFERACDRIRSKRGWPEEPPQ